VRDKKNARGIQSTTLSCELFALFKELNLSSQEAIALSTAEEKVEFPLKGSSSARLNNSDVIRFKAPLLISASSEAASDGTGLSFFALSRSA